MDQTSFINSIKTKYAMFIDGFDTFNKTGHITEEVNTNLFDYIIGLMYKIQEIDHIIYDKYTSTTDQRLAYYDQLCKMEDIFFLCQGFVDTHSVEYVQSLLYASIFFMIFKAILTNSILNESYKKAKMLMIKDTIDKLKEKAIEIYSFDSDFILEIDELIFDNKDLLN